MDYYVSKKAGSLLFRQPHKMQLVAGEHIPADVWNQVDSTVQADLLKTGMVEGFDDPDNVKLSDPVIEGPRIGVGNDKFMPEATVQRGERHDEALQKLIKEQEERARKAKEDSEVDPEQGGSADGVVQVELPPEEDDDDYDYDDESDEDDLTPEELAAIREMDAAAQQEDDS